MPLRKRSVIGSFNGLTGFHEIYLGCAGFNHTACLAGHTLLFCQRGVHDGFGMERFTVLGCTEGIQRERAFAFGYEWLSKLWSFFGSPI